MDEQEVRPWVRRLGSLARIYNLRGMREGLTLPPRDPTRAHAAITDVHDFVDWLIQKAKQTDDLTRNS